MQNSILLFANQTVRLTIKDFMVIINISVTLSGMAHAFITHVKKRTNNGIQKLAAALFAKSQIKFLADNLKQYKNILDKVFSYKCPVIEI